MSQEEPEESEKENSSGRICPRCGNPYSYIEKRVVRGRTYYYAVHYIGSGKDRKTKKCYLGAEIYEYVNRLHGNMVMLRGLILMNPIEYLQEILNFILDQDNEQLKQKALDILKIYIDKLSKGE